jgi:hypothetical protein
VYRSRKKTPVCGITTCRSEKDDKRIWHRRFRAKERDNLLAHSRAGVDADYITTHFREVSNPWNMGKDGRRRWTFSEAMLLERYPDGLDMVRVWRQCCLWK